MKQTHHNSSDDNCHRGMWLTWGKRVNKGSTNNDFSISTLPWDARWCLSQRLAKTKNQQMRQCPVHGHVSLAMLRKSVTRSFCADGGGCAQSGSLIWGILGGGTALAQTPACLCCRWCLGATEVGKTDPSFCGSGGLGCCIKWVCWM